MKNFHIKRPAGYRTKKATVLHYLTFDGSLNCFEAEVIGDHCLHTTISTLRNEHDVNIQSEFETVPTRFGKQARVKRYWMPKGESMEKAQKLLALWRTQTKATKGK